MTKASPLRHRLGAPKKEFRTDPDRATIDIAEVLSLVGFNQAEAYDLAAALREGVPVEARPGKVELGFRLPITVEGRIASLRQKSARETTSVDSLRRSLLAARLLIATREGTREQAIAMLDNLLVVAAIGGPEKLRQTVEALWHRLGKRRRRRVARKAH